MEPWDYWEPEEKRRKLHAEEMRKLRAHSPIEEPSVFWRVRHWIQSVRWELRYPRWRCFWRGCQAVDVTVPVYRPGPYGHPWEEINRVIVLGTDVSMSMPIEQPELHPERTAGWRWCCRCGIDVDDERFIRQSFWRRVRERL